MKAVRKRQKITFILLLVVMVLTGALLYSNALNRDELDRSPEPSSVTSEKVLEPDEATELKDGEAEFEPEEEEDLLVKVGTDEFPVIFEDGDYENLDRARLIRTVNNLYERVHDFEFGESTYPRRYHINGREVETNRYLLNKGRGNYGPVIKSSAHKRIGYYDIIVENGVQHLVLSRQFIEAFIEASSQYWELTDELNDFIDRLNQVKSVEIDNLTEAEIDSMLHIDPRLLGDEDVGIEGKRECLREITLNLHFQSTNVIRIGENPEQDPHLYGNDAEMMIVGKAIYYLRKDILQDKLPSGFPDDKIILELSPPSNFNPRLHVDPDAEPFI